jgi:hypothetical protein
LPTLTRKSIRSPDELNLAVESLREGTDELDQSLRALSELAEEATP